MSTKPNYKLWNAPLKTPFDAEIYATLVAIFYGWVDTILKEQDKVLKRMIREGNNEVINVWMQRAK